MNNLTKSDLIKIAKNYNIHVLIPKYYTLRKDDLINKMNQHLIFDYANKKIIRKEHSPINVVAKEKKKRVVKKKEEKPVVVKPVVVKPDVVKPVEKNEDIEYEIEELKERLKKINKKMEEEEGNTTVYNNLNDVRNRLIKKINELKKTVEVKPVEVKPVEEKFVVNVREIEDIFKSYIQKIAQKDYDLQREAMRIRKPFIKEKEKEAKDNGIKMTQQRMNTIIKNINKLPELVDIVKRSDDLHDAMQEEINYIGSIRRNLMMKRELTKEEINFIKKVKTEMGKGIKTIVGSGYLDNYNLKELRRVCRIYNVHNKITRFTKLTKEELIEEMKKHFTFENNKINIKKQDIKEEDKPTTRSLKAAEEKKKKEEEEKKRKEDEEKKERRERIQKKIDEAKRKKKEEEEREKLKKFEEKRNKAIKEKEEEEEREKQKKLKEREAEYENALREEKEEKEKRKKQRREASKRIKEEEEEEVFYDMPSEEEQEKERKKKKEDEYLKEINAEKLLPKPLFKSVEKGFNFIKDLQKKGLEKGEVEYDPKMRVNFIISAMFLEKYQTAPISTIITQEGQGWSEKKFLESVKFALEHNYKTLCIPVSIVFADYTGHQNLLIIKVDTREIIRFEPHGSMLVSKDIKENEFVNNFLEDLTNKINNYLDLLKPNKRKFNYYEPITICPKINNNLRREGFQSLEGVDRRPRQTNEGGGFCQLWSMFFMECILRNPDMDIKDVYKNAYTIMNDDPKYFRDVIRGYFIDIDDEIKKMQKFYAKSIQKKDISQSENSGFAISEFFNKYIKLLGKRKLEISKNIKKVEFTGEGKFRRPLLNKKIVGSGAFNKPLLNKKLSKY